MNWPCCKQPCHKTSKRLKSSSSSFEKFTSKTKITRTLVKNIVIFYLQEAVQETFRLLKVTPPFSTNLNAYNPVLSTWRLIIFIGSGYAAWFLVFTGYVHLSGYQAHLKVRLSNELPSVLHQYFPFKFCKLHGSWNLDQVDCYFSADAPDRDEASVSRDGWKLEVLPQPGEAFVTCFIFPICSLYSLGT